MKDQTKHYDLRSQNRIDSIGIIFLMVFLMGIVGFAIFFGMLIGLVA